ncbi:aldo/keto reductase, partial [Bacillus velezensis]|nr:aldo/keto reductase [Bacillus velezensis]
YKNEEAVGQALSSANLPREEVFITTKLWNGDHTDPQKALEESLRKLRLDYIDLYLIHWPLPQQNTFVDAWRGLIKLQEQGLAKSIGVSNFHIH